MGENIGRTLTMAEEAVGAIGDSVGKVYKIEGSSGRYTSAGVEIAGTVNKAADEGST